MICEPCQVGLHQNCKGGDCTCEYRLEGRIWEEIMAQNDENLAEFLYNNVMFAGSEECAVLTNGAGPDAVKRFVRQVLSAYKAMRG